MTKYHNVDEGKQAGFAEWIPVLSIIGVILFFVLYSHEISAAVN